MRLIALMFVVGSLILLGRWHASQDESKNFAVKAETDISSRQSAFSSLPASKASIRISNGVSGKTSNKLAVNKLPVNATEVRELSRARYELPKEAAKLIDALISLESECEIETRIIENEVGDLVTLEVTANEANQRTTAKFLLTVYPPEKIASYKRAVDSDDEAETIVFSPASPLSNVSQSIDLSSFSQDLR